MNCKYHNIFKPLWLPGLLLCSALWVTIGACKHEPFLPGEDDNPLPIDTTQTGVPCDSSKVYFDLQILPILQSNCAFSGCHDAASAQDGVVLTDYESVMRTADVRPFNPSGSDLYEAITEDREDKRMPPPPRTPLTAMQIDLIRQWIIQGAPDLSCDPGAGGCNTEDVRYSLHIQTVIQNKCQGCHSGAAPSGGIGLSTHAGVAAVAANGRLIGAIDHANGYAPMPQGGSKLPACTIDQFKAWVAAGSPNN
jgi:hypothetical protein